MATPTDFLRLYQELDLAPGADIDELRRAYRRRVSELHPDRPASDVAAGAVERLQQLTVLYSAATHFHRRHGRLPGAAGSQRPPADAAPRSPATHPGTAARGSARAAWWFASAAVLVIWLSWAPDWQGDDADPGLAVDVPQQRGEAAAAVATHERMHVDPLRLGMAASEVLAVQGQPVSRARDRWDYGPSWIAFEKDKVSNWYSSPLRPLKGASRHPSRDQPTLERQD